MSARRLSEKVIDMPQDPQFLSFERTDGDALRWPTNTTRIVGTDGEVNFMEPLPIDHPQSLRWRLGVAQGIAAARNMAPSLGYILRSWPTGYSFYDHHKGPAESPRHDLYLYGAPARRYRSINEFIPHAIWLFQDQTLDPSNCACKYCRKKPQKEVSAFFAPGILRATHSSTPAPSRLKPGRPKLVTRVPREKSLAFVQKAPVPTLSKSPNIHHKATMLVERNSDLRAVFSKTAMKLRRWFRVGELLWCLINPPIAGPNGINIHLWPGLVDEVKLKNNALPRGIEVLKSPVSDHDNTVDDGCDPVPWSVCQSTQYRVQLVAVNYTYVVSDDQVLPYQAHVPTNELIDVLKAFPTKSLHFDREALTRFNPCPKNEAADFSEAVAPYAMALQISSALSSYWSLTDEWSFEYRSPDVVPFHARSSSAASINTPPLSTAQQSISSQQSTTNELQPADPLESQPIPENIIVPNSNTLPAEAQRTSARVLGKNLLHPPHNSILTQTRFQGLWWGAERIWTDEFIRLKMSRSSVAPHGAECIFPPAGPGKAALDDWLEKGKDPAELGAITRGVFMRLDGLFVVDVVQSDGISTKKECRASGMLYELVDRDWEDSGTTTSLATATESIAQMAFVPAPSPLNPHVLTDPIPEPAVSIEPGPSVTPPVYVPNPPLPTSQLSHPSPMHYSFPVAPAGYALRPILPEGHEAVISLSLISGRYYPQLLSHPLLETAIEAALERPKENGGLSESNYLWALDGIVAGLYNAMEPSQYKPSRLKMVQDADDKARQDLENYRSQSTDKDINEVEAGHPDAMEVDS